MLGCNNIGHHPLLVYAGPDPSFLLSAQWHGPQHGPDVKFPCENPIFTHVCQARLGKRKVRYLYWAALLAGTSEHSEWIEGGRIRVTQTQKREYANIMVVCMCSVGGFSQRSTGTMSILLKDIAAVALLLNLLSAPTLIPALIRKHLAGPPLSY